jgi:hypothetical protein
MFKWNIIIVYGPAHERDQLSFLQELSHFCTKNNEPFVVGGDFNIIRYSHEKNKIGPVHKHTDAFNDLIQYHELHEVHMFGGGFTWSNNQSDPTLVKLDRILISKAWEIIFPLAKIKKFPRELSDHNPLMLVTDPELVHIKHSFKFEMGWLSHPDFKKIVDNIWSKPCKAKSALDKIQQKLELCKQYLKGWDWNRKGHKNKRKAQIQVDLGNLEKLEEQYGLNTYQLELKMSLLGENLDMIIKEETYWKQRSHEKWLLKGDGNNEFFHRIASGRKKKNDILFFEDNGTRIEGEDHMLEHATSYYADLFGPAPGNLFQVDDSIWNNAEHISDSENRTLCEFFYNERDYSSLISNGKKQSCWSRRHSN